MACQLADPDGVELTVERTVDLEAYAGQMLTIVFETGSGPKGDVRYDWAGWGAPRLLEP